MDENVAHDPRMLAAVRLGWLTVEAFARLRRYAAKEHRAYVQVGDATQRFDFSDRDLTEQDQLHLAVDQLRHAGARFDPQLPPTPLPSHEEFVARLQKGIDLDRLQGELDEWSKHVWIALSAEHELLGRAFTYGGSLADTHWHTDVLGVDRFDALLRASRLEYIAARFDSIADYLPPYTARILHYTLYKWRIDKELQNHELDRKRALRRLESQAKVWHDLIFGSRSADSYLSREDLQRIRWRARAITALIVLGVVFGVFLAVLGLSTVGRNIIDILGGQIVRANQALIDDLGNWENLSVLLATFSAVVALLSGFFSRVSGWLYTFNNAIFERLKINRIYYRTYRGWS
jgi:hypothetical protein